MLNTFGLRSVNTDTFNVKYNQSYWYPQNFRNIFVTLLRIHNFSLNILGYKQDIAKFSGCARMLSGLSICIVTLNIGERNAEQGMIIGPWYDEALMTGIAQIARGATEAFMPYGRLINLSLDVIGTIRNLISEIRHASVCQEAMGPSANRPHPNPSYPFPFWLLYLA